LSEVVAVNRRRFTAGFVLAAARALAGAPRAVADEKDDISPDETSQGYPNAVLPTLGGRQFWADELFYQEWHIQRNVFTGHCRLLDSANFRHGWGSFDQCRAKLDEIKRTRQLPPMKGEGVVVMHGLFRSSAAMSKMGQYLRDRGGYTVFNVSYPSTRGAVADHARWLEKIVSNLDGIERIHFVAHSLGNLVIRHYFNDQSDAQRGVRSNPQIGRMVMLGPPNQGAQMAEALGEYKAFHLVAGQSAGQLARQWKALEDKLATPACEFGILAGGRGTAKGYNPWLGQDNDMVVSVESTRLPGAADFAVLPVLHTLMMDDATVQQYTLNFLRYGYFVSPDERHPISPEPANRS
jgi:pimeloyl-ACP methyl ester carboxylesterase